MRRVRAAVAGIAGAAMTLGVAAPASAQEEPEALGFAVTATEGQPGTLVLGEVDTDDVAEHCTTDLKEFQARFAELVDPDDGVLAFAVERLGREGGPVYNALFPDDTFTVENHDQAAFSFVISFANLISSQTFVAEEALPETFLMTFADIATQDPVGEQATFDPEVGEASVVVPEVEPGLWALAAACVGPETEADALIEAIQELGAILEELGAPATHPDTLEMVEFFREHFDLEGSFFEVFVEGLQLIGPTVLEPIMVPDALGAVGFCVLDAEGNCPADEPPAPPPGEPPTEGPFAGEPAPAQPVVAAPTFTG